MCEHIYDVYELSPNIFNCLEQLHEIRDRLREINLQSLPTFTMGSREAIAPSIICQDYKRHERLPMVFPNIHDILKAHHFPALISFLLCLIHHYLCKLSRCLFTFFSP